MRLLLKENKILLLIICLALIVSFIVIGGRMEIENNNKSYDIILDYNEIEAMAAQSEHDISWWLKQFKEMGINKVGLSEENMFSLIDGTDMPVSATVMDIVMKDANWEAMYPDYFMSALNNKKFDKYDLLIEAASKEAYNFVSDAMVERYQPDKYLLVPDENGGYIVLDGNAKQTLYTEKYKYLNSIKKGFIEKDEIVSSKLMYLNLGMQDSKVQIIKDAGMVIIPRTGSYEGWNDTK